MLAVSKTRLDQLCKLGDNQDNQLTEEDEDQNYFRHVKDYDLLRKDDRVNFAKMIKELVAKLH